MYLYIRMLFSLLVGLYTSRVVLQTLGISDYGLYNVVGGFVSIFMFINGTMTVGTQRFLSYEIGKGNIEKLKKVFSNAVNSDEFRPLWHVTSSWYSISFSRTPAAFPLI